jgi:hypothetical protein
MKTSIFFIAAFLMAGSIHAQFKGKMEFSGSGDKVIYTVYSDISQYRYEFSENGQEMVVIVKPEEMQTLILIPEIKSYMKTSSNDFRSAMNDPVQSSRMFSETMEEKVVGTEKLNGLQCVKKEYYSKNTEPRTLIYTVWYSKELKMPVKIIDQVRKRNYMELTEVEKWTPVPSYFEVPAGYQEMNPGQPQH